MGKQNPLPFFSIVIPALNEEQYLPRLLLDLSNQTFRDFEIIIVDAKSDDQTAQKAGQFEGKFDVFTLLESDKRNVSFQRNIGAEKALADWLIFLDADNRLPADFLEEIKRLAELQKPDFLSTWFEPDSEEIKHKAIAAFSNIAIDIYQHTPSPLLLEAFVCINKKSFLNLGGFDETIPFGEGSDLLKRAYASKMKFIFNRDPKYVYSYRRLRKQGFIKTFRNNVQIQFARMTNYKPLKEKYKILYPMEGGRYFEIPPSPSKRSQRSFLRNAWKRIFKPLEPQNMVPKNKNKRKPYSA